MYEDDIKELSEKNQFTKLHQVIQFEDLLLACYKAVYKACSSNLEFWNVLKPIKPGNI